MSRRAGCRLAVSSGASLLAAVLVVGCGRSDSPSLRAGEIWRPVERFAPSAAGGVPDAPLATATIGDETRPTLVPAEPLTLNYSPRYRVPADGRVALHPPLPDGIDAARLLVEIRVRPADRWLTLPGRLAETYVARGKRRVDVELDLSDAAGRPVGIFVTARVPQRGRLAIDTEPVVVPERAALDFAIGVADVAANQGPVDFAVAACEPGGAACSTLFEARVDPRLEDGRGWHDERVELPAFAAREVVFRFETRAPSGGDTAAFWGDPTLLVPAPREPGATNLILLSLDTLRADHVGAYGYERDTTPFIDAELAGRGTLFERYVAAASSTRPSHMTMFTSLPPSVHGATENTAVRTLPAGAKTLAELLRAAGFATAAVTEDGAIDRSRGFGRGFGTYVENRDAHGADLRVGQIEETFASGLAWLDRHADERFFLFLHTYQVHNPFTPPPAYDRFFDDDAESRPPPPRADWDPLLYDREIRYADDQVRALVDALERRGLLDDTLFVLTSDHGEAFAEHGFVAHGANVHAEVLNVPLVFRGPGVPAGRRVAEPVPMIDLMPTLLDLMGVAAGGREMGRSQADVVRGGAPANAELRPIFGEAWATRAVRTDGVETIEQPSLSLELGDRKLIRSKDGRGDVRYELYDTRRDPREEVDLYAREGEAAAPLREMIARYRERTRELHDALAETGADAPALDPDVEEKLRALGYLE